MPSSAGVLIAKLGPLIGLVFVFVLFWFLSLIVPNSLRFATIDNVGLMLRQTAVVGIAALGMTMIIISGGIDLSVASNIALGSVIIGLVMQRYGGMAPTLAAMCGVAVCAAAGLLVGTLITSLRLLPFIVTLGAWGALRGLAELLANNERVYPSPNNPDAWRATWLAGLIERLPDDRRWMIFPPGVWLLIFLAIVIAGVLRYTRFGRHVFAIGSNPQTARLCGVPIARTTILVYFLAGALVGLAAVLDFSYTGAGDPTGRMGAELDIIAAVVIGGASLTGGQGSVTGTLIGAMIMTIVANGCNKIGLPNSVQKIVTGGIIILAVALDRLRSRRG